MCVFKQGEIWWYEFTVDGKRLRKSSRTTDRGLAELIEAEHRQRVEKGLVAPTMKFSEAALLWLEMRDAGASRARYLKPRTIKTYRHELEAPTLFFNNTRLCEITNERCE